LPELPEVETIKRDLEKQVLNKEIINIRVILDKAFENPHGYDIKGKIIRIYRQGKYLLFDIIKQGVILESLTSSGGLCTLIIHLRMTGKLIYQPFCDDFVEKHSRVVLVFADRDCLIFNDVRTFGKIEVVPFQTPLDRIKKIGIDVLAKKFDLKYFREVCCAKKIAIKNLLLDQTILAGIGNIYAQEILFAAKVSPQKKANVLSEKEIKKIYKNIHSILSLAIIHNGTSISDYRRIDEKSGEFQNFLKVYGKKNCATCHSSLLKIKQGSRSTTYCAICQKE